MRSTDLGRRSLQLTRWPLLFPVNVYLVREDDGLTLIDTAVGGSDKAITSCARQFGAPIVRIVLTHAHGDHVGSLDALRAALPDAEVAMSERTARFLSGDLTCEPGEARGKLPGSFKICKTRPNRLLKPGDRVGSLEVLAAPGHSPDHIAFLDIRDRTLFAGDAFQTRGGVAVSGTVKPLFPFPAMGTWDKEIALRSARELLSLSPSRLGVGHGNFLEDATTAMQTAVVEAERRLGRQTHLAS